MAWIEVHQSLVSHRKTIAVADILDREEVQVVGHLVTFWLWALDNVPDGSLAGITPRMIARAAHWQGEAGQFVTALIEAGFINEADDHLVIHDWFDYAGRLIERRNANAARMREKRATHVQDTTNARAGATVPNPTVPNRTEPNHDVTQRFTQEKGEARARASLLAFGLDDDEVTRSLELYPEFDDANLPILAEECISYHLGDKRKPPKNRYRAWLNWLRKRREFDERDKAEAVIPKPVEVVPTYFKPFPDYYN